MEALIAPTRCFTALMVFCILLSSFALSLPDTMGPGSDASPVQGFTPVLEDPAVSPTAEPMFPAPLAGPILTPTVTAPVEVPGSAPSAAPVLATAGPTPTVGDPAAPSAAPIFVPAALTPTIEDPVAPVVAPAAVTPSGTIRRLTKQDILATVPAGHGAATMPFITSPSGKYEGYLLRRETAPGAGGFGNDFCYIQVRDTSSDEGMWESDCSPASLANACTLMFTEAGLEVFDGSRSTWDAGVDAQHLETLELVDDGDMRIRTRDGELAWKASDSPLANQQCGMPGSPGLASAEPPFAAPVESSRNLPFGLPSQGVQQQSNQPVSLLNQQPQAGGDHSGYQGPLVDNTPFDSASWKLAGSWFTLVSASAIWLAGFGIVF